MSDIIKLNVGGVIFMTLRDTLDIKDSYFQLILTTNVPVTSCDGDAIFIDRSPKYFEHILQFIRTGMIDKSASLDIDMMQAEANYYGLSDLEAYLRDVYGKSTYDRLIKLNVRGTIYPVLESKLKDEFFNVKRNWISADEIFICDHCEQFHHLIHLIHTGQLRKDITHRELQDLIYELSAQNMRKLHDWCSSQLYR